MGDYMKNETFFHPKDIERYKYLCMLMYLPIIFIIPYLWAWVSKYGRANIKVSFLIHVCILLTFLGICITKPVFPILSFVLLCVMFVEHIILFIGMYFAEKGWALW